ncbi:9680_t:CDS:2, partial [Acaulospora morrowiae]
VAQSGQQIDNLKTKVIKSPAKSEFVWKAARPAHGSKPVLKEKFVEIYEKFFKAQYNLYASGDDPSEGLPHFWDELFLLRVNSAYLMKLISETSQEKLWAIKA